MFKDPAEKAQKATPPGFIPVADLPDQQRNRISLFRLYREVVSTLASFEEKLVVGQHCRSNVDCIGATLGHLCY